MILKMTSLAAIGLLLGSVGCQTKSDLRRQQEFEHLRDEVGAATEGRADLQETVEELKGEVAKLGNVVEGKQQQVSQQLDAMQRDMQALTVRVQAIEQRAVAQETAPPASPKASLEEAKRLYDDQKYDDAIDMLKSLTHAKPRSERAKAQYLLAESYFANKDFASAALAYSDFEKSNPKDSLVPTALYKVGLSMKNAGKAKEANLFFKDLVDRFPHDKMAAKARKEMRRHR